jgi:hypothetical protein
MKLLIMKKLLIASLFVILLSCEKDIPAPIIDRTCWECRFMFISQISEKVYRYCNRTDIGLTGTGEITKEEIDQFEKSREITGVLRVECTSFKE